MTAALVITATSVAVVVAEEEEVGVTIEGAETEAAIAIISTGK